MEPLPFIDEHIVHAAVPAERLWAGLIVVLPRFSSGRVLARLLGCEPASGVPEFSGVPGDTVPAFRVVEAVPGNSLMPCGRHRFSRYRLEFAVDEGQVRARTYAAFPGYAGRLYRKAVIGCGAHRVVTRHMLMRRIVRAG